MGFHSIDVKCFTCILMQLFHPSRKIKFGKLVSCCYVPYSKYRYLLFNLFPCFTVCALLFYTRLYVVHWKCVGCIKQACPVLSDFIISDEHESSILSFIADLCLLFLLKGFVIVEQIKETTSTSLQRDTTS